MIRVWFDATVRDANVRADMTAALDRARRELVRFLEPRGFGDVDAEAIVLVALVDAFGRRTRSASTIAAAAHLIERGFLGL